MHFDKSSIQTVTQNMSEGFNTVMRRMQEWKEAYMLRSVYTLLLYFSFCRRLINITAISANMFHLHFISLFGIWILMSINAHLVCKVCRRSKTPRGCVTPGRAGTYLRQQDLC